MPTSLTALAAFRRGALLGARGNSGVILSQLLGALVARIGRARHGERNATMMAEAMAEATEAAYAAVGTPVEGTILTVARAASDAAVRRAADERARARDVFAAAAGAAREALAHTPEQLEQLACGRCRRRGRSWAERDPRRGRDGAHRAPSDPGATADRQRDRSRWPRATPT